MGAKRLALRVGRIRYICDRAVKRMLRLLEAAHHLGQRLLKRFHALLDLRPRLGDFPLELLVVDMAEIAVGIDAVADHLLELLHIRKTAVTLPLPDQVAIEMDLEERLQLPGLDPRRADLMPAGAVLLDTILKRLGATEITLCDLALREGLILDYIHRHGLYREPA